MRHTTGNTFIRAAIAPLVIGLFLGVTAQAQQLAQRDGFPPGQIPGRYPGAQHANDTASQTVRIDRLENRVRKLTGEIEQLQHQMRQMRKQLEAFQKDIDFRFKESSGSGGSKPRRRSDAGDMPKAHEPDIRMAGSNTAPPDPLPQTGGNKPGGNGRGDVFDPGANPGAPGAPRQLGSTGNVASAPLQPAERNGPRSLPGGPLSSTGPGTDRQRDPDAPVNLSPHNAPPAVKTTVAPADASPRQSYSIAMAALRSRQYSDAETGFKTFLKRFPNSTLADDVHFNLGESYYRRGRYREAAEQYLKVSTDYRKSSRAPDSLYRLGLALEKLGAREQACASYAEVERRYPRAPGKLRVRVERQMTRAKC